MRAIGLFIAVWILAGPALADPLPSPIAQASQGQLQCYAPNPARRTCQAMAGYAAKADGSIDNPSTLMISPAPLILMRAVTPVTIKAGQVCGYVRASDITGAQFTINGQPATPEQAAMLSGRLATAEKAMFDHEICTAYVPDGDGLIAKASIDGVAQPKGDQKVIWVSPADGYKVGP